MTYVEPPPGWVTFGSHVGTTVRLEFSGVDEDGLPLWEREKPKLTAIEHLRQTASDARLSRPSEYDFDVATNRPLSTPGDNA